MARSLSSEGWFLGLDSSTQVWHAQKYFSDLTSASLKGLKATVVDGNCKVIHTEALNFARDLASFGTTDGYLKGENDVVTESKSSFAATCG